MNPIWVVLIVSVGVPLVTLFVNMRMNKRTLAAAQPKSEAERIDLNIKTQNIITDRIEADNTKLAARLAKIEADLAESIEQNHLMVENTRRAQSEARAARIETTEARSETRQAQANFDRWRKAITKWANQHEAWDQACEDHLRRLDPEALKGIPPRQPMPEILDEE